MFSMTQAEHRGKKRLALRKLQVHYAPDRPALHELSATLDPGLHLILGPNASGKSTLLKAIAGIVDYEGEILLDEHDLSQLDPRARARTIAYVPQRSALSAPLLAEEVVAMARFAHPEREAARRAIALEAMKRAGCLALQGRSYLALSGGQQQQLLLARALASGARLLLLDEVSSALDIRHTLALHRQLRALAQQGYCVLWALHDLHLAQRSEDQGLLLDQGRLVAQGLARELLHKERLEAVYGVTYSDSTAPSFALFPGEELA